MTHILVVEDDVGISGHLRTLFESQGYSVDVFYNGRDADEALKTNQYDILMLDWDVPGMTGPQICRNYRTRGGLAPVIMLTGKDAVEAKELAFEVGADDYLTKPYSLRELSARIKALLRRNENIRQSITEEYGAAPPAGLKTEAGDSYIGSMFAGKYKIVEVLGEGGSGTVYGAVHVALNRTVAVKFLHNYLISRTEARGRFDREARALSGIQHPNIVAVFDYGIENGQPYMVLERLDGVSLSSVLEDNGPMSDANGVRIFTQICDAMDYTHSKGILHRDLKPENIMLVDGGKVVKLVDLGLAKNVQGDEKLTKTGIALGTGEYMSPEQCNAKPLDQRSDVYSMGCLMYETLTGAPPFKATHYLELFNQHTQKLPAPYAADMKRNKRLEKVVLKALAKSPNDRQQSFAELKKELLTAL